MRYESISKQSVDRLKEQGFSLSEGDRSFIDEITMIVLSEDPKGDCTDEEIIQRITTLAKRHLKPTPDQETAREPSGLGKAGIESSGLWNSMIQFFTSRKEGSKE